METKIVPFDMTQYIDSKEAMAEYLTQVIEEGDTDELIRAIGYIAKARGMSQIAKESGLGRESLYKTFSPGSKPRFDTIAKVARSLGLHIQITCVSALGTALMVNKNLSCIKSPKENNSDSDKS